jgi:hypothetical protein
MSDKVAAQNRMRGLNAAGLCQFVSDDSETCVISSVDTDLGLRQFLNAIILSSKQLCR